MHEESKLREDICLIAKSMFDRGLTGGSSGNISARLGDGKLLVTPTGGSFGRLDPARLSLFDENMNFLRGDQPTKEMPLHAAFYETRKTGAIVHLHSCHSVALSLLPPLTAYGIMKLGKVALLPYFMPGDPKIGDAIRGLAGKRSAVMLAHHGPVVAGKNLEAAAYAMEELEETAKLALMTRGMSAKLLDEAQISGLVRQFDVEWD